jgi:hypothetical protein
VIYAHAKGEFDQLMGEFRGVFSNADGNLFVETYNQLKRSCQVVILTTMAITPVSIPTTAYSNLS